MYREGYPLSWIGKKFGVSAKTVKRRLKEWKIIP